MKSSFPYPFSKEQRTYSYSNDAYPITGKPCIEVNDSYIEEISYKRQLIKEQPGRCFRSLPHTHEAQYEAAKLTAEHLVNVSEEEFSIDVTTGGFTLYNSILNEQVSVEEFSGDALRVIGDHVQEDLILMTERDQDIYMDAGYVCFPAGWSLTFNLGMPFLQIHEPVPGFTHQGLDRRILRFLRGLHADTPYERLNWSLSAGRRLDHSLETITEWKRERQLVSPDNAGNKVQLRVERQRLFRLPETQAILFTIHTHHCALDELDYPLVEQLYKILESMPRDILKYKGVSEYEEPLKEYLERKLDYGREPS
ncbi:heme-dependent oxidative N-demethylase family protein [Alteribacter natronophilus]|uniref:heme-dependent oxidative N-demethylase family protein n=1 Tax=Alteribacter natronophilus TaxID=2583810 RepID=UPI00110E56C1|nr:DUF3445 domain-containing protein [Alteribacter natronophilus]TMW73449.1 DUF3445 domain-containing protein [Alteribacter natronophilus]